MGKLHNAIPDLGFLDAISVQDTPLHRMDPRAKLLVVVAFMLAVVSFDRYQLSALFPFFIFPAILMGIGRIPFFYLLKKALLLLPFILFMGVFNLFYDREIVATIGAISVTGGELSFCSLLVRFFLTVLSAFALVAITGFSDVCLAMERLGMPKVFAVQLLFLYRYLFVLAEEGGRMTRARELRSFDGKGMGIKVYASLLGHMLLRTFERAQRIYQAMLSRGFKGEFPPRRPLKIEIKDIVFVGGWVAVFLILRLVNISTLIGRVATGGG